MIEFQRGDLAVGIGHMPGRKQQCVTVHRGSVIYVAAYLRNEEEADRLIEALRQLTQATTEQE